MKHTHEGGVTLTVEEALADTIEFNVTDTGDGIEPQLLDHLFELRDERVGLWLSQQLVKRMGGEIRAKSVRGVGSVFYFQLQMKRYESDILDSTEGDERLTLPPVTLREEQKEA